MEVVKHVTPVRQVAEVLDAPVKNSQLLDRSSDEEEDVKQRVKKKGKALREKAVEGLETQAVTPVESDIEPEQTVSHPPSLVLKLKDEPIVLHQPGFDESIRQESGLSFGEKVANDGQWREKWLSQKKGDVECYGRTQGEDRQARRTWEHEWRREDNQLVLTRRVIQYSPVSHTPLDTPINWKEESVDEKWYEKVVVDESTGEATELKFGSDYKSGTERRWQSKATYDAKPRDKRPVDLVLKGGDSEEAPRSIDTITTQLTQAHLVSYEFEEHHADTIRSITRQQAEDGTEMHVQTFKDEKTQEHWVDEWTVFPNGHKEGRKKGVNTSNEEWFEEWHEKDTRLLKKWKVSADKLCRWGVTENTYTVPETGVTETSTEKWARTYETTSDDHVLVEEFADRWWVREGTIEKWGEKAKSTCCYAPAVDTPHTPDTTLAHGPITHKTETHEKWYSNSEEKKVDRWCEDVSYGPDGSVLTTNKYGDVEGSKIDGSTTWGDRWRTVCEPGDTFAQCETDKWWREAHGNAWGEKEYKDASGRQMEEKWYDNGTEKQSVRSHVEADGVKWGLKVGSRWDEGQQETVSWRDKWSHTDETDNWYDRSWTKVKVDGRETAWGELEGVKGKQTWKETWTKGDGKEYSERKDDDGYGNFKIQKKGVLWNENGEVVDWFVDRYGESLGAGEKWAFKEGADVNKNRWLEKWNENRTQKTALKEGSNAGGDQWTEQWKEQFDENGKKIETWAAKSGKNGEGQEWYEEWIESENKKHAKKTSRNLKSHEEWEEAWGEEMGPDGEGLKWTSKWADDGKGARWGQSWGDQWNKESGHKWGEEWNSHGYLNKWEHDTSGPPN